MEFILRTISTDGTEQNVSLGELYSYIDKSSEKFTKYVDESLDVNATGVVLDVFSNEFVINGKSKNFIMTENGSTFKRL